MIEEDFITVEVIAFYKRDVGRVPLHDMKVLLVTYISTSPECRLVKEFSVHFFSILSLEASLFQEIETDPTTTRLSYLCYAYRTPAR